MAVKKNPYDKTSSERSERLNKAIKEAGGGAVNVRFKTSAELQMIDDLVAAGEGTDRSDVIRKLVAKRHKQIAKKA